MGITQFILKAVLFHKGWLFILPPLAHSASIHLLNSEKDVDILTNTNIY